jgi:hypothetical protein
VVGVERPDDGEPPLQGLHEVRLPGRLAQRFFTQCSGHAAGPSSSALSTASAILNAALAAGTPA